MIVSAINEDSHPIPLSSSSLNNFVDNSHEKNNSYSLFGRKILNISDALDLVFPQLINLVMTVGFIILGVKLLNPVLIAGAAVNGMLNSGLLAHAWKNQKPNSTMSHHIFLMGISHLALGVASLPFMPFPVISNPMWISASAGLIANLQANYRQYHSAGKS